MNKRQNYESRCDLVAPGIYTLREPKDFTAGFYPKWRKHRGDFYATFDEQMPAFIEAVAWLKCHLQHWDDLMVTLAPLSADANGMTQGQTIVNLHAIEITPETDDWLLTLCHEFEHVRQYAAGTLALDKSGVFYKGIDYSYQTRIADKRDLGRIAFIAYNALPWEKAARDFADQTAPVLQKHLEQKGLWVSREDDLLKRLKRAWNL